MLSDWFFVWKDIIRIFLVVFSISREYWKSALRKRQRHVLPDPLKSRTNPRPTLQVRYPLRCNPPVECPWETAWMHVASPERDNVLSAFRRAGRIKQRHLLLGSTCRNFRPTDQSFYVASEFYVTTVSIFRATQLRTLTTLRIQDYDGKSCYDLFYNHDPVDDVEAGERSILHFKSLRSFALGHGINGSLIRVRLFETA